MDHAWLDSLSEDWVSQAGSDRSADPLPPLRRSSDADAAPRREPQSRIPRRALPAKPSAPLAARDIAVLSERSANEINMSSQRLPSAQAQDFKATSIEEASFAPGGSVVRNNARRRSSSERQTETPEWKRRLVHGKMSYGEQRDLFSSAAAGLQDIFKPPAAGDGGLELSETTLPSSPPLNPRMVIDADMERFIASEDDDEPNVQVIGTPSPSPRERQRETNYSLNVGAHSSFITDHSRADARLSAHGLWRNGKTVSENARHAAPEDGTDASRKTSGQSDMRNEDLSPILIGKRSGQDGKVDFAPIEVPVEQLKRKLERLHADQMLRDSEADLQSPLVMRETYSANAETAEDSTPNEGFVNMQRGGRSGDGSFYQRALSSDMGVDTSEMLPEESLQASTPKQFPSIRTQPAIPPLSLHLSPSPSLPRAPFPSPDKRQVRETGGDAGGRPAGSPLKLFGPYDTYTNQTLLRRISQFEETSGSPSRASLNSPDQEPRPLPQGSGDVSGRTRAVSRFGDGHLEGFEFTGNLSYESEEGSRLYEKAPALSPVSPLQPPEVPPHQESELAVRRRRRTSMTPVGVEDAPVHKYLSAAIPNGALSSAETPKRDGDPEGKRPRTSPSKGPTPKRRRTLHRSDVAFGREGQLAAVDSAHKQMQAMMSWRGSTAGPAELKAPGSSSIARPRSASSGSSASQQQRPAVPDLDDSQGERVKLSSGDAKADRPRSIRTEDFVSQAAHIMALIRNQVMPGLASLEESEAENPGESPGSPLSNQESTNEPLSRPPSREGKPLARAPQRQEDPELIRRLKQYQERSDGADLMAASLQSTDVAGDVGLATLGLEHGSAASSRPIHVYGDIVTDIPNVRITSSEAQDGEFPGPHKEFPTGSSERSTSRTYPTTSSRGSESRRTIMPASVSHLIPDRVGSMYLDKQNNIWVKRRDAQPVPVADARPLDDSEDDPFASIPDLSVDITKELQNLRLATAQREAAAIGDAETMQRSPRSPLSGLARQRGRGLVTVSPLERPGPKTAAPAARDQPGRPGSQASDTAASLQDTDRVSNAASAKTGDSHSTAKRRNLTISFSSPIASVIHDGAAEDTDTAEDEPDKSLVGAARSALKHGPQLTPRSIMGRPPSARGPGFVPRPVSRIDERDEESTVEMQPETERQVSIVGESSIVSHRSPDGRQASLSFIINRTPSHGMMPLQADESAIIGRNVGKLSLSPLSEFTVNNADQSFGFEVSYVMGHRHLATGDGSKRVMSMTIRELVDKLGEVEPYEPFWEDMTELDLHGKQLASLHMLDVFCGRVVTLDASGNRLGHLDGVPATVRHLKASRNLLTELTSWDHLLNLQYMDISGNEVKSLSALRNLVHLRSLQADDCQLTRLDGLESLDGLLCLRARSNAIEEVDFSGTGLERLSELDLGGNRIGSARNLELLPALARLRLRGNRLGELRVAGELEALRQLDVSDNELEELDLGHMPGVRSVHADRNRIRRVGGFGRARRLDSLSLRAQRQGDAALDLGFLAQAYEVRKLFLSGNYLGVFEPAVDFLNLQLLELANCGLQRLPERMGQLMPNLRTLNINFNAVADLSPLQFLPRLKKLLAAGNRLADATAATRLLMDFPHLRQLDVRDNPMTLGFYAPAPAPAPTPTRTDTDADADADAETDGCGGRGEAFTLADADAERDGLFASRLDEATRLRRRLHQVVLVASCRRLRKLDGLAVRRDEVLAKDGLLETLAREGLVAELEEEELGAEAKLEAAAGEEAQAQVRTRNGDGDGPGK